MKLEIAHYILRNDKDEIIIEFESNLPVSYLQKFLHDNFNLFDKNKFVKFVSSFKDIKNKFTILI